MGWMIVQQPTGQFARFSDIVDNFTAYDMTAGQAVDECQLNSIGVDEALSAVVNARRHKNGKRFEDAIETIRLIHGKEQADKRKAELGYVDEDDPCPHCSGTGKKGGRHELSTT